MLRQSCIGSDTSSVTRYPFACDLDHTQEKEEVKCLWERLLRRNYQGAFFSISVVFLGFRRCWLRRSVLVRRGQRAQVRWDRLSAVLNRRIPQPCSVCSVSHMSR